METIMTWQPIETAPKDGTRILAYDIKDAEDTQPQIALWLAHAEEPGWYISLDHQAMNGDLWNPPTHWMPLPEPPQCP